MTDLILELLWRQLPDAMFLSREDFCKSLEGWEIEHFDTNGEPGFAVLTRGPEFHFVSFQTGHPIPVKAIYARFQKVLDTQGYVTTKTPKEDTRQQRFNLRLGFNVIGEDEYDIHYRIERPHHA